MKKLLLIGSAVLYTCIISIAVFFITKANYEKEETTAKLTETEIIAECMEILKEHGNSTSDFTEVSLVNKYLNEHYDEYTYYTFSEEVNPALFVVNNSPSMISTGYQVNINSDEELYVVSVFEDTPAEEQGLKVGDVIEKINGKKVTKRNNELMAEKLPGKDGSTVKLEVKRKDETITLELKRKTELNTGVESKEISDKTLLISIKSFTDNTANYIAEEISNHNDAKNIVFDLRGNNGGRTEGATASADLFLESGELMMSYYSGKEEKISMTKSNELDFIGSAAVLVDEETASAAEIFTALMKQYGDAAIVGETTFGKGVFQLEQKISNGGIFHFTAGYYTVGDWECYDGVGIVPDAEVKMDKALIGTDEDTQLQKTLEILSETD